MHSDGDMRRAVMQFHHRSDPICYQDHAKLDCEAALYRQSGQRQETICFPAASWIHHNTDLVSPDLKDYKEWTEHIAINDTFTKLENFERGKFDQNYVDHCIAERHRTQSVESFLFDKTAKPLDRWNKNPDLKVDLKKPEYLGEKIHQKTITTALMYENK